MTETTEQTMAILPRARVLARILGWELLPEPTREFIREADRENFAKFTTPEGMRVYMRSNEYGNRGKVRVSYSWPENARGELHRPYRDSERPTESINVSLSKDDVAIAKEIRRRLIDVVMPAWTEQKRRAAESDQYTDRGWAMACELAKAFGQPVPPRGERHDDRKPRTEHQIAIPLRDHSRATVTGSGINIPGISVSSPAQAIRLITAISAILAEGAGDEPA